MERKHFCCSQCRNRWVKGGIGPEGSLLSERENVTARYCPMGYNSQLPAQRWEQEIGNSPPANTGGKHKLFIHPRATQPACSCGGTHTRCAGSICVLSFLQIFPNSQDPLIPYPGAYIGGMMLYLSKRRGQ